MDTEHLDDIASASLERELIAMAERLHDLRARDTGATTEVIAELETAMEELRVTAEEVGSQQRRIAALLEQSTQSRATVQRLVAAVPTPVLTTDPQGAVIDVNEAAVRLLGVPADRVRGKPLQAYVDVADRRAVRAMVSAADEGDVPEPRTVVLTPRSDGRHRVVLLAVPATGDGTSRQLRWFVDPTPAAEGFSRSDDTERTEGTEDAGRTEANDSSVALLGAFAELISVPIADPSLPVVLRRVVGVAAGALPEAADVTITIGDPRSPELLSSGSPLAQAGDGAQLATGEGPCVDAFLTDQLTATDDLSTDRRWPALGRRLRGGELCAAMGVPLHGEDGVLGVLNLYGRHGARLADPAVRDRAELFGRVASALVQDSRRVKLLQDEAYHLRRALVSRPEIDQAKGILMARFGYSPEDAFQHLVALSQKRNVKLREVARQIVEMVQRQGTHRGDAAGARS